MTTDSNKIAELENTVGLTDPVEKEALEKDMGFTYRAVLGEILYTMVTCCPDISFATTKLSQCAIAPAKCHIAIKNVFRYLLATVDNGITYWCNTPNAE